MKTIYKTQKDTNIIATNLNFKILVTLTFKIAINYDVFQSYQLVSLVIGARVAFQLLDWEYFLSSLDKHNKYDGKECKFHKIFYLEHIVLLHFIILVLDELKTSQTVMQASLYKLMLYHLFTSCLSKRSFLGCIINALTVAPLHPFDLNP